MAAAIGAIGAIVSGVAGFMQMSYQASIAKANAEQARVNAKLAQDVSEKDAEDIGKENAGLLGETEAGQGATGLALGSPSAARGRAWLRTVAYQDAIRRVEAGNRESANYQTQANVFDVEAKAAKTAGMFNLVDGFLNAGASLVGGAKPNSQTPGYISPGQTRNRYYNAARSLA